MKPARGDTYCTAVAFRRQGDGERGLRLKIAMPVAAPEAVYTARYTVQNRRPWVHRSFEIPFAFQGDGLAPNKLTTLHVENKR